MELASMLAGEPFSDRPASVCPVIGGFLRSYNDHVDDARRQDLYRYAAEIVGTKSDARTERRRSDVCLCWARHVFGLPPVRVRALHRVFRCQGYDVDGVYAARAAVAAARPDAHLLALELVDELIAMSATPRRPRPEAEPGRAWKPGPSRLDDVLSTPSAAGARQS